jgi:hypothetical protein
VQQHIEEMPHSAFNGMTPDEVYFGKTDGIVASLAAGRVVNHAARIEIHRGASCHVRERLPLLRPKGPQPSERSQLKEAARTFAG